MHRLSVPDRRASGIDGLGLRVEGNRKPGTLNPGPEA